MVKKDNLVHGRDELQQTTYVIQKLIGKLLNHSDMWIIVNLHKRHGLEYSDIEMVFKHCIERGNRNITYIEKVAIAYAEKGDKALEITSARALNELQKNIMPRRRRKEDKKPARVTMPYLPFDENLSEEEIEKSKKLKNIDLRIQVRNEVEKETMMEVLKQSFRIHGVSNIFELVDGDVITKYFNIEVSKL